MTWCDPLAVSFGKFQFWDILPHGFGNQPVLRSVHNDFFTIRREH